MKNQSRENQLGAASQEMAGTFLGKVVGFSENGIPLVSVDTDGVKQQPLESISIVALGLLEVGDRIVLSFVQSSPTTPVIMGIVQSRVGQVLEYMGQQGCPSTEVSEFTQAKGDSLPTVTMNGSKLELTSPTEIKIQCGKSSITLTKSGKILVKGEHVLTRATKANKIKGGSIQLN